MMQQLLPTHEPSESDLVYIAMARPLREKIDRAMMILQHYEALALRRSDAGYFLAYSGGKDSGVIMELAKMAGLKYEPVYNVTTIDPPELIRFMKDTHPQVRFSRPEMNMMTMMAKKSCGPPTRLARWCCEHYKERGGDGKVKIIGVRAAESARRKGLWKSFQVNRRMGEILCPIVYWTDEDVWKFHVIRKLPYCCLYDEGFKRIGCIGCPMQGPKGVARDFERWPRYEALWKKGVENYWNNWHGVPTLRGERRWFEDFGSWEGLWEWWITGRRKDGETEECQGMLLFT